MKKCKKAGMRKKGEPVPQPSVKPARAKVEDWCTLELKVGSWNVFEVEEVFVGSTRSQKQGTKKIREVKSKKEEEIEDEVELDIKKERDDDEEMPDDLQPQDADKMSIDEDVVVQEVEEEEKILETPLREHCYEEEETRQDSSEREPRCSGNTEPVEHRRTGQVVVHSPKPNASSSSEDTEVEGKDNKKEGTSEIRKRINTWCLDHETTEDAWLDDNIIKCYLELMCSDHNEYKVIDPTLWPMYKAHKNDSLLWIEQHLNHDKTCFFPICEADHWILLIFNKTKIWYADSLYDEPKWEVEILMKLMNRTRISFDIRNPKQQDKVNCGVHVCLVVKSIVTQQFWYGEAAVLGFRRSMKELLRKNNYELFSEAPQRQVSPSIQEKPAIDDDDIIVTYSKHPILKNQQMARKFPAVHRREDQRKVPKQSSMFLIERNETSRFNKRNWGNERSSTNQPFVKPFDYESMSPKLVTNSPQEQTSRPIDRMEIEVFETPSFKIDSEASRRMELPDMEVLQKKKKELISENQTLDVYSNNEVISIETSEVHFSEEVRGESMQFTRSECAVSKTGRDRYSGSERTFRETKVQNLDIDLSKMEKYIHKIKFKVIMIMANEERIDLTASVCGEVFSHSRRRALCVIFKKWLQEARHLFHMPFESAIAYNGVETIYAPQHIMKVNEMIEDTWKLQEDNFNPEELRIVSQLSRRRGSEYEITVASIGRVITFGPEAHSENNRVDLEKCIQCISNQALRNENYYFYADGIYPVNGGVISDPDATTEIKLGFSKVVCVSTAESRIEARMALQIRRSCFIEEMPLMDFICAKYLQLKYKNEDRNFRGLHKHHLRKFKKQCKRKSRLDKELLQEVGAALQGLQVRPTHLDDARVNRTIILDRLDKCSAKKSKIVVGSGVKLSLAKYFKRKYNIKLKYPRLPFVRTMNRNSYVAYPIEFLTIVPGQRVGPNKMTKRIQKHMTDAENVSVWIHAEHMKAIECCLQIRKYQTKNRSAFKLRFP